MILFKFPLIVFMLQYSEINYVFLGYFHANLNQLSDCTLGEWCFSFVNKPKERGEKVKMYVNYFDRYVKQDDEKPSIGILLCHSKKDELFELTLAKDTNIHASEYQLYLPTKEELRKQMVEAQKDWEEHHA